MKKLFWKIVKWAVDKFLQKKIDGDKPKEEPPAVDLDGPESEKPKFLKRR